MSNLVLDCDYTQGSVLNKIYPDLPVTNTNVELKHGVGAEFKVTSTTSLKYGNVSAFKPTTSLTIEAVVGENSHVTAAAGCILSDATNELWLQSGLVQGKVGGTFVDFGWTWAENAGRPMHLALVWNGTQVKCYRNGVVSFLVYNLASPITQSLLDMCVGKRSGSTVYFGGAIKLVRLYKDKALTQNEVTRNWQNCVQRGLV
jgi:hypothetical protein